SIGAKYTFLWIFGGIFLLLSLFVSFFIGMMSLVMTAGDSGKAIPSLLLAFIIPIFVIVFFVGFFFITKQMGKGDERKITELLHSLFRDVMVEPTQVAPAHM